jgi:aryl-alcohol dehydrogenase (NADP+)
MTFGVETDEAGSHEQLDRFIEAGGTLVDTADVYGGGQSEEIIGRWFASRPADVTERVVLATKGRFSMGDEPNSLGLSTRHLTRALDASLTRLGLDRVDLYQVHAFDPLTPLEETLRTLDGFIRAGKINYYGLSNFTGWQLTKTVHVANALGVAAPVTLQPQYSLIVREIEWEVVPGRAGRRYGDAAVESAGWRLAVRQVPAGRASNRRYSARRRSRSRHGGVRAARHRPHLEHH